VDLWDDRAERPGLHAVLSRRWSERECADVDRAQKELIEEFLPGLDTLDVVDLGCGIGRLTGWLGRRARRAVGVDRSAGMVRAARRNVAGTRAEVVHASTSAVPLPSHAFGAVLAVFTLQHVTDEDEFRASLDEMARLAAPGGRIVIIDGYADGEAPVDVSSPRTSTVVRPAAAYESLAAVADRIALREQTYVNDLYLAQLWQVRQGERGNP